MEQTNTLIVGASAAGLSCAAHLKKRNIDFILIEKQAHVAHAWRNHYDRLHLHTNKSSSNLPFVNYGKDIPKYPSRKQVISYMEDYCKSMGIEPVFNTEVSKIMKNGDKWITKTEKQTFKSSSVIVCTGNTNIPLMISKPGLDTFNGEIIHSSSYKNGKEFKGKNVLVIGFGNSACEIAICLHEHGAFPSMSVRSKVNVIPRDILGIPVLKIGILQSKWSPKLADKLNKPLIDFLIGDIEKYGLKKLPFGPVEQIVETQQIPLLDIGTMKLIKEGKISIYGDIKRIKGNTVLFENSEKDNFDVLIMATGYETGLDRIIDMKETRKDHIQAHIKKRKFFGEDNLYFCGFYVAPTGMLREIKIESGIIADHIAN